MSRRREVQKRIATLGDIDGIMVAMKNLALLQIRTLSGFLQAQQRVVAGIEEAAADFLAFHEPEMDDAGPTRELYVVVGSERGFCGDFNEKLLDTLTEREGQTTLPFAIIAIGRLLEAKMGIDSRAIAFVEGATVAEEVQPALARLSQHLGALRAGHDEHAALGLSAIYHSNISGQVRIRRLLPLSGLPPVPPFPYPPRLNLAPPAFHAELTDQYLHAVLHEILYSSLMVENRRRLEHMDSAIRRLEKDQSALRLKFNALRQEEIIEEIEVLLLSAEALAPGEAG